MEMIGTLVHQLTRNLTEEQIKTAGFDAYFVDHTTGVFPQFASSTSSFSATQAQARPRWHASLPKRSTHSASYPQDS